MGEARYPARHSKTPDEVRSYNLETSYRITLEEYEQRFLAQKGRCRICDSPERSGRLLAVDHDHVTGLVRGLLCSACNRGLGFFRDRPDVLRVAADYLDTSGDSGCDPLPHDDDLSDQRCSGEFMESRSRRSV